MDQLSTSSHALARYLLTVPKALLFSFSWKRVMRGYFSKQVTFSHDLPL